MKSRISHFQSSSGFTLVELLVAISLFSIAIAIAVGGFVRAIRTQRELVSLIAANSNASLAIEQIAREMRTGTGFACVGPTAPCDEITFTNADGETVGYRERLGALERQVGSVSEKITAENVLIQHLRFYLFDQPNFPPRITIVLSVSAPNAGQSLGSTNLQTTVSSRRF